MNVDTDEFLKSLKSRQVSPCECSAKNPDSHTKACPRFQTMHCWCPPATGPGQPHEKDCSRYSRPVPFVTDKKYIDLKLPMKGQFFGHGIKYPGKLSDSVMQAQAYTHALKWAGAAALKYTPGPDPVVAPAALLCQAWFGSDDQCGLPADSPIHTTSPQRHDFSGGGGGETEFEDGFEVVETLAHHLLTIALKRVESERKK
jgi:hypothetical protein